jgi:hypothetical protein
MKYFKRFNIIEFKSENDKFDLNKDLYKLGIYLNGTLFSENDSNIDNSTFTLVSSRRLSKLLKTFKAEKIREGLYIITNISIIPIHIIIISELENNLIKEITALKELTLRKDRKKFLKDLIYKFNANPIQYKKYIEIASSNYFNEYKKIQEEIGELNMTYIEKNLWAGMKFFKIDEKLYSEGMEKGIIEGFEKGKLEGIEKGKLEGIEKGKLEGIAEIKIEMAKRALVEGFDIKTISLLTALDVKSIKKLAKELKNI